MVIKWLGHSCFLISNDEATTILTDPYDSYVGRKMPKVSADVVITSHSHKDHSAINNVNSYKKVIDNIGEYCYNDIKIITFCRNHDNMGGNLRGKTLITKIITDGLSLCHLGDIGEFCTEDIVQEIGATDILFIPVGGNYTIDSEQAKMYVEKIKPAIVIPMHFKDEHCVFDIDSVVQFTTKFDNKNIIKLHEEQFIINKDDLDKQKTNIILMKIA